jgi:hypothetical protein
MCQELNEEVLSQLEMPNLTGCDIIILLINISWFPPASMSLDVLASTT